jgi:tetratricopeptide (TPR) repeat protein
MLASCRALAVVIGAALAVHAAPAHAQKAPWAEGVSDEAKAQAKTLLDAGNALLLEKKYVEALEQYKQAITHWDHPAIRFNMSRCLIQLGRNVEAFESLEKALKYGAAPHEATVYEEALGYQKLLASQIGDLTVACTQAGVSMTLDGKPLGTCPTTVTKRVLTGQHQVLGTKRGLLPKTVEVIVSTDVATGTVTPRSIDITLDPLAKAARIEHRWPQWIPWTVFGSGLALGGIGLIFQTQAVSQMDEYDRWVTERCAGNCPDAELADVAHLETDSERNSAIGVSLMVTGGAAVATGAVMLWLNRGRTVYPPAVEVAPLPGGAAMSWSGRF